MNEVVFHRGRAVMYGSLGVGDFGDAWPSDLLAYRREWEPFVAAHVALWRYLNSLFESTPTGQKCPPGVDQSALNVFDPNTKAFCSSLMLTRLRGGDNSQTKPPSISAMWDAWRDKSASDILIGADKMLKQQQDVVRTVAGQYKDELLEIAKFWKLEIKLPDVPTIDTQGQIIAKIEGTYVAAKGILQLAGYATGTTLAWTATQTAALTEGLTDTVKALPKAISSPWLWVGVTAVVVAIGAGMVVYYVPKPVRT
jgi:hypothetical protein